MKVTALRGGFDNIRGPFPSAGEARPLRLFGLHRLSDALFLLSPLTSQAGLLIAINIVRLRLRAPYGEHRSGPSVAQGIAD